MSCADGVGLREDLSFADSIARACHEKYAALPKTGKPNPTTEWTLLSAVVMVGAPGVGAVEVVALGTGSKCVGAGEMSAKGDVLNDSHAEVMARRAFMRYLYCEAERLLTGGTSEVFRGRLGDSRCALREGVTFHFYTSRPPCGDASIFPKADFEDHGKRLRGPGDDTTNSNNGDYKKSPGDENLETTGTKRRSETDAQPSKRARTCNEGDGEKAAKDIHRTGAKCVQSDAQDPRLPGVDYHVVGALRTKPGRGDPTLSLSCSDKLARWNAVGCQGALLSLLVEPVRFSSLVVGGGCPFSADALTRAVVARSPSPAASLTILRSALAFPDGRTRDGSRPLPCASSVAWCRVHHRPHEVAVRGRKQGVTKKVANTVAGRLLICKRELARRFVLLYAIASTLPLEPRATYARLKAMATEYQREWRATREQCFPAWPTKPASLLEFTLDEG